MVPNRKGTNRNLKHKLDVCVRIASDAIYWVSLIILILTIAHSAWKQADHSKFIKLDDIKAMQQFYDNEPQKDD